MRKRKMSRTCNTCITIGKWDLVLSVSWPRLEWEDDIKTDTQAEEFEVNLFLPGLAAGDDKACVRMSTEEGPEVRVRRLPRAFLGIMW